uniref:Fe2OG dioxygenase domain-containing protein n=1 Tax=Brassica campestris TaxID=3711 RepID=M4CYG1_BRACM
MENEKGESSSTFKMDNSAQERSLPYVPDCYAVPPSYEPRDALDSNSEIVPTIDISRLKSSDDERRGVIQELSSACQRFGFFQGKNGKVLRRSEESISRDNGSDNGGLGRDNLSSRMDKNGMQVMAVNCYPPCPDPTAALGLPPHSDYSCITILLQNLTGLEIFHPSAHGGSGRWVLVPEVKGVLKVHIGDHVEVLSNGLYKSVIHKVTLNEEKTRISLASLHSLGMDDKMSVPYQLVNNENPARYRESSFNDFLDFLVKNDISQGERFIDTLRIKD